LANPFGNCNSNLVNCFTVQEVYKLYNIYSSLKTTNLNGQRHLQTFPSKSSCETSEQFFSRSVTNNKARAIYSANEMKSHTETTRKNLT